MTSQTPSRYQISFVSDKQRFQTDFMATEAEVDRAVAALEEPMQATVSDFQVFKVVHEAGSAGDLVSTLVGALSFHDDIKERFKSASDVASEIDSAAASASSFTTHTLDFVWDNGGGDDNCFTEGYLLPTGCDLGEKFEELVSKAMEPDAYDLEFSDDAYMSPDADLFGIAGALENAADRMEQEGFDDVRDVMRALAKEAEPNPPTAPGI
jgi:hypothetical protein